VSGSGGIAKANQSCVVSGRSKTWAQKENRNLAGKRGRHPLSSCRLVKEAGVCDRLASGMGPDGSDGNCKRRGKGKLEVVAPLERTGQVDSPSHSV
jgi:hypothetical protein